MRSVWCKIGFVVIAMVLVLLVGELAVRLLVAPVAYAHDLIEHPERGWCMRANLSKPARDQEGPYKYRTNAGGFRGPALPAAGTPAPADTHRILFLGDSFLNAHAVREEERMQEQTSLLLDARDVSNEVYTLSCDGYGTAQELMLLREHGASVAPDVVVLALFSGNDLADNTLALAGEVRGSGLNYLRPYLPLDEGEARDIVYANAMRSRLRHRSRLFRVLEKRLYLEGAVDEHGQAHPWPTKRLSVPERLRQGLLPQEHLGYLAPAEPGSPWSVAWSTTQTLLREFRAEVEAIGARLLVVVIPSEGQVRYGARERFFDVQCRRWAGRPLAELVDWNLPERTFGSFFAAEGIDTRLLCEPLRAATRAHPERALYAADAHLLASGHRIAAEIIADWCAVVLEGDGAPLDSLANAEPTEPVDLHGVLGPAAHWQDYRHERSVLYVAWGWKWWAPQWGEEGGGWAVEPNCGVVLPRVAAPIVLRGSIPAGCEFPVTVSMSVKFIPERAEIVVEEPGEFELVYTPNSIPGTMLRLYEDCVPVDIRSSTTFPQRLGNNIGLIIHEVGFRPE